MCTQIISYGIKRGNQMIHTKEQIINKATKLITEYLTTHNIKTTYSLSRMTLNVNEFAIWMLAKIRNARTGDIGLKVLNMLWNNSIELGFRVEMGRTERIYVFDLTSKIWDHLKRIRKEIYS